MIPAICALTFSDVVGPSSSTSDSGDGADLFTNNLGKDVCFSLVIIRLKISIKTLKL